MTAHPIILFMLFSIGNLFFGPNQATTDQDTIVAFAHKAAVRAVNFHDGDAESLAHSRADFSPEGWKDFMKHMEGFIDSKGAPTFTSYFIPSANARVLGEKDGIVHFRIPGILKQTSKASSTTYKAALEVHAGGSPIKITRLQQIMCASASTACQ
ncbi:MAG TPA: hypothetical protein VIW23_11510 [Candidatus Acidoferrum sp.]